MLSSCQERKKEIRRNKKDRTVCENLFAGEVRNN
jgi:hypothetical protein